MSILLAAPTDTVLECSCCFCPVSLVSVPDPHQAPAKCPWKFMCWHSHAQTHPAVLRLAYITLISLKHVSVLTDLLSSAKLLQASCLPFYSYKIKQKKSRKYSLPLLSDAAGGVRLSSCWFQSLINEARHREDMLEVGKFSSPRTGNLYSLAHIWTLQLSLMHWLEAYRLT